MKISEQQFALLSGENRCDFSLKVLMGNYREGQKEVRCVFV